MPNKALRFSAVSPRRQQLIRICQALHFGFIRGIRVQGGEPCLEAAVLVADERLDIPEEVRPEIRLDDFNLSQEWRRLLVRFDQIQDGAIERIEVRAGIPRRVLFESQVPEARS
jgi:hypothetical protein